MLASPRPHLISLRESKKANLLFIVIFFGAVTSLHLWSLLRYPAVFTDEGWLSNRAWNFKSTGAAFGTMDLGALEEYEGYQTYFQWLPSYFRSLGYHFADTPDLFPVRLVSLIFGLVLLAAVMMIGQEIGGRRLGILSAGIVSLSAAFLYSAHLSRDDIYASALGYLSVAIYLKNRTAQRFGPGFLTGILVGLAFEIHPHSVIFAPALAALYLADSRRHFYKGRHVQGFAAGGLAAGAFFFERHLLRYPETFSAISQLFFLATHTPPILTFNFPVIFHGFLETGLLLYGQYGVLIPAVLWAGISFIYLEIGKYRSSKWMRFQPSTEISGRTLLILNTVLVLGMSLLIRNKFRHYAILVTPAIDLLLAASLYQFFQRRWEGAVQDYAARVAAALLVISTGINWAAVSTNAYQPYQRIQAQLRLVIRPGETVMGAETYWFALWDHAYFSWIQLIISQRYTPGSSLEQAFLRLHPDIWIVDENMQIFIADSSGNTPFLQHFKLSKTELEHFINQYSDLVLSYKDPGWPQIWVYRINWKKHKTPLTSSQNNTERWTTWQNQFST